jgi:hypothetical protein
VAAHWFRIPYAKNAFLRSLGTSPASLTLVEGIGAMLAFGGDYKPQHAQLDRLNCSWGPIGERFEFAVGRRMQRADQPENTLTLTFSYALTPPRTIHGTIAIEGPADAVDTEGYRAVVNEPVIERRLELVTS